MTVTIFSLISTQHCEVLFHSYGHTVNDYTLKWDRNEKGEVKKKTFLKLKQFFDTNLGSGVVNPQPGHRPGQVQL